MNERNMSKQAHSPVVGVMVLLAALICVLQGCSLTAPEVTPTPKPTATPQAVVFLAFTPTSTPTGCALPPSDWQQYIVQAGDTLLALAIRHGVTVEVLRRANCLPSVDLRSGQSLFVPSLPTPTPCGVVPSGWVAYMIRPGDTVAALAAWYGIDVAQVMRVNCLPATGFLVSGQRLFLPPLPTPTTTPCVKKGPAGWREYRIHPGDTLRALAAPRGVSVDAIIRANCLTSDTIRSGEMLYLPPLAVAAATAAPVLSSGMKVTSRAEPNVAHEPAVTPTPCYGIGCRRHAASTVTINTLSPDREPCATEDETSTVTPWIDFKLQGTPVVHSGEMSPPRRVRFFLCGFSRSAPPTVQVIKSDIMETLLAIPTDDDLFGRPVFAVDWAATCDLSTGQKLVFVAEDNQNHATKPLTITLLSPSGGMLVRQQRVSGEGQVLVDFCGYTPGTELKVNLYYPAEQISKTTKYNYWQDDLLIVPITARSADGVGVGFLSLRVLSQHLRGRYYLYDLSGKEDWFELIP